MKKLLLLSALLIFAFGLGQTPITDANFNQAIETCLSTNPIDGMCSDSEYGAMPYWDVSNVTNMFRSFFNRRDFNADLSNWDVRNVTNMRYMFYVTDFNQDISNWNVGNVQNMSFMFASNGNGFNIDLSNWDVSSVWKFSFMFYLSNSFNQDIGNWDVSSGIEFYGMFYGAENFNQNLGNWNVSNANNLMSMLTNTNLNVENYDNTIIGWSQQNVGQNLVFDAEGIFYCDSADERQILIDNYNWIINDAGPNCKTFSVPEDNVLQDAGDTNIHIWRGQDN
tara:strand:- start:510 stop:1349 length:840 start_codon:yes stop_codon:yes gene_type:complete